MPFSYIQGATVQLTSGAVSSGDIQSGSITGMELASGAVQSGHVGSGAVQGFFGATRHIASGTVGVSDFGSGAVVAGTVGSGAIVSGNVASGQIGTSHLADASVTSGDIASGTIFTFHIASGGVLSGNIASGQIGPFHLASGAVQSGHAGSGLIDGFFGNVRNINSGTVGVFDFGSGAVIAGAVGSGAIVSGNIASGQIGVNHLASGTITDAAMLNDGTFLTTETISGGKAVAFSQSGTLRIAMASVSGRMPAIGIVASNFLSGIAALVHLRGRVFSTVFNFSGWPNQPLYVGASGDVVASGAPIASGNIQQIVGVSINGSGLMTQVGDPLEGVIAQSGDVGSGAITGQAISGFYCVASGTLGTYDAASGFTAARSQLVAPLFSGTSWSLLTEEIVSGVRAVCVSQSGNLRVAMAAVSGRMPAIGVVVDNVLSGIRANVYSHGLIQFGSGLADYSGWLGYTAWVGRSGQIVQWSGSFNSGGLNTASGGDFVQRAGVIINSGAVLIDVAHTMLQNQLLGVVDLIDTANRNFGV